MAWGDNDTVVEDSGKWDAGTPSAPVKYETSADRHQRRLLGALGIKLPPNPSGSDDIKAAAKGVAVAGTSLLAPVTRLGAAAPMAMRMLGGAVDAMGINSLIAYFQNMDKKPEETRKAMLAAEASPWNAIGAAVPAMGALPGAMQYWRDAANRARARVMAPGNQDAQRAFREKFGSYEQAGEATRNVGGKDVARFGLSPDERAAELEQIASKSGEAKGTLTDKLSEQGVTVSPKDILADITARRDQMFGNPVDRSVTHP